MTASQADLRYRTIFHFWYPLALTWAMMAVEGPVLNSIVSRLPDQRDNLAAFGIAGGIAMIIESPVIMLLSATVALAKGRDSFHALKRYGMRINLLVTLGMLIAIIPQVHEFIAFRLMGLQPRIAELLYSALCCLILWPASIGYRRLYQGLMIRSGQTRNVAIGSIARISTMALSALALSTFTKLPGAVIGACGLGFGVLLEAVATRFMARRAIRSIEHAVHEEKSLQTADINAFYVPLALTSVLGMAVNPMLVFFMSRFENVAESLAVFPVIDSFVFQFRSPGFSYQEIGIALINNSRQRARKIRNFGIMLMIICSGALGLIAATPLLHLVYTIFPYQLNADLAGFALVPTQILVLLPALSVLYSLQRAVLINQHETRKVTTSTIVEVGAIFLVLLVQWKFYAINGAIAAAVALMVGRILANFYLSHAYVRALQRADNA